MKEVRLSIEINASKERVWTILWDDMTFRDWASIIDDGMYVKGELQEGNEIQFISSVNGYGVTSLVEKLNPNEFVLFRHSADTKESGQQEREKEWTGGTESYSLTEINGVTTLVVKTAVPQEQEETFNIRLPRVLERIKTLAETGKQSNAIFLSHLSSPARSALEHHGITSLELLSKYTEKEILKLHGVGPASLPKLRASLKEVGLSFRS